MIRHIVKRLTSSRFAITSIVRPCERKTSALALISSFFFCPCMICPYQILQALRYVIDNGLPFGRITLLAE